LYYTYTRGFRFEIMRADRQ